MTTKLRTLIFSLSIGTLMLAGTAHADVTASTQPGNAAGSRPFDGPLTDADIQSVRVLGRAVLSTRQATVDPVRQILHQDVKALKVAIDQALKTFYETPPKLTLGERTAVVTSAGLPTPIGNAHVLYPTSRHDADGKLLAACRTWPEFRGADKLS
jgi:hypothetical protein